jgi:predicted ATPase
MQDYGLPAPRDAKTELQMERLKYDDPTVRQQLRTAFERDKATWTAEFNTALATIIDVRAKHGGFVVIEGAGGAGKTFLTKGLVNYFRSEGLIVRVAAPTGLAATLYEGGMTMHDLFKLPVLDNAADDEFTSNVNKHPQRQELLNECDILFIDEALNLHLGNLNASIEALQTICSTDHEAANKTIVFVGDRKQILPVVKGEASDAASIAACIVSMPHWGRIPKINLTSRFRNQYDLELAKFVEAVANGAVKSEKKCGRIPTNSFATGPSQTIHGHEAGPRLVHGRNAMHDSAPLAEQSNSMCHEQQGRRAQ